MCLPGLVCDSLPEYRIRIALIPANPPVSLPLLSTRFGPDFSIIVSDSETGIPRNIEANGGRNGEDYRGPIDTSPTDRLLNLIYPWKYFPVRSLLYPGLVLHVSVRTRQSLFSADLEVLIYKFPPPRTAKVEEVVSQLTILLANLEEIYRARDWCTTYLQQLDYALFVLLDRQGFTWPCSADNDRAFGIPSGTVRAQIRQFYRSQDLVTDPPESV